MKSRLQRWSNKKAIRACATPLYAWVREGDKATRLKCIRNLGLESDDTLPSGESYKTPEEMVSYCHSGIVEFLLDFARGKVQPGETNKKGEPISQRQKPYSVYAGTDSDTFVNVSPTCFGVTLANLYPYLIEDKDKWDDLDKTKVNYPCTALWPMKIVKRYIHFINTVFDKVEEVFKNYEEAGGDYYDSMKEDDVTSGEEDGEEDESEEDFDNVF